MILLQRNPFLKDREKWKQKSKNVNPEFLIGYTIAYIQKSQYQSILFQEVTLVLPFHFDQHP